MLQIGKEMVNNALADYSAQYVTNFKLVEFNKPDAKFFDEKEYVGELIRYNRRVLAYCTLLKKLGLKCQKGLNHH